MLSLSLSFSLFSLSFQNAVIKFYILNYMLITNGKLTAKIENSHFAIFLSSHWSNLTGHTIEVDFFLRVTEKHIIFKISIYFIN